jgi:formate-dependent phosphoribosylglycinamide formyltransferase (GAR transformylase)
VRGTTSNQQPVTISGTAIASAEPVARRIAALFGIVVILGLAFLFLWRVYLHHERGTPEDTTLVTLSTRVG